MIHAEQHAECGIRYVMYPMPEGYDAWGWSKDDHQWEHSFCVVDDFGNVVPVSPFVHDCDDQPILAPDYDPQTPVGEPYKYIMYYPTIH